MSTAYRHFAVHAEFARREHERSKVDLPAIVTLAGREYSARIINIALGGAMIECAASFPAAASFVLRCGSIAADSTVVWQKGGWYGVNFRSPLSEEQVREQLTRNNAINSRKQLKGQSNLAKDWGPAVTAHQTRAPARESGSSEHLTAIEASHQQVESCVFALETIMSGELSDIGQFSAARLRLRQANVARTNAALEACRHLKTTQQAQHSLGDLQRRELDVSRMISEHVQHWTIQSLQNDWSGYRRATTKILVIVRELIAAEKELLCPMLRCGSQIRPRADC